MSTVAMILFISIITLSVPCFWSNKENEALKQLECTQHARASFEWSHLWVLSERSGFGNLLVLVSSDCKYKRNSHRVVRCEVITFLTQSPIVR